jgi:hypothetical protein
MLNWMVSIVTTALLGDKKDGANSAKYIIASRVRNLPWEEVFASLIAFCNGGKFRLVTSARDPVAGSGSCLENNAE